jgi:hypothetical protein
LTSTSPARISRWRSAWSRQATPSSSSPSRRPTKRTSSYSERGFVLDHSAENTDPQVAFGGFDNVVVRDITKRGYHDGGTTAFGFSTWDEDGHMLVENLQMADGSEPQNPVGVYVNATGTVTFRDCHVEGVGNNGRYASSSDDPIHVEGGVYKNNDIAQIRLGSPGSYVKNATVVVDDHLDHDNSRGIRVADGHGPVDIAGCEVVMESGQGGGVVSAMSGGKFNLSNSRIYVSGNFTSVGSNGTRGAGAILVDEPTEITDPETNTIQNVAITGEAKYRSAICLRRDNNAIKDVCIHQTGDYRNGVAAERGASNNHAENVNVNVPGTEVVDDDGDIDVSGLTLDGACAYPSGVDQTETTSTDSNLFADAPWPSGSSRLTYATMGHDDTVTADAFMGFEDSEDEEAALLAMPHLLEEFVEAGDLNVRFRQYGFESESAASCSRACSRASGSTSGPSSGTSSAGRTRTTTPTTATPTRAPATSSKRSAPAIPAKSACSPSRTTTPTPVPTAQTSLPSTASPRESRVSSSTAT